MLSAVPRLPPLLRAEGVWERDYVGECLVNRRRSLVEPDRSLYETTVCQALPTEIVYTLFHDHAHVEVQCVFIETDNLVLD